MRNHLSVSLAASLGIHIIIVGGFPVMHRLPPLPRVRSEVHFERSEAQMLLTPLVTAHGVANVPAYIDGQLSSTVSAAAVSTFGKKDAEKIISQVLSDDRSAVPEDKSKDDVTALSESLSVSKEKMEEIKNTPAYMDYYKFIREKIRQSAMQKYDQTAEGDITVIFILTNKGRVAAVTAQNPKNQGGEILKQIALESVRKSSPFPPFPESLKYQNLEFSLEIHFRRKN